jgi:hypothetical protein
LVLITYGLFLTLGPILLFGIFEQRKLIDNITPLNYRYISIFLLIYKKS